MAHIPIHLPHPVAWRNPVTMRAWAVLPAAPTWDATPTEQNIAGAGSFMLQFTYTRGEAGGAFDWQIQSSIYSVAANVPASAGEWADESIYGGGAIVAGADTQSRDQREYQTYEATSADAETFTFGPLHVKGTVERLRIRARESGDLQAPGNLAIVATFYP